MKGCIIIAFNLSHPTKGIVPFVVEDDFENTIIFESPVEAEIFAKTAFVSKPFGFTILDFSTINIRTL